jgi:hypothetical protein
VLDLMQAKVLARQLGVKHEELVAVRWSGVVQVFRRRDGKTIDALVRPASEKRQGTKSRDVGTDGAAGSMGI